MKIITRRYLGRTALGGLALVLAGVPASLLLAHDDDHSSHEEDDDEHDHDRALEALKRGEVQPLETVLAALRSSIDGTIVRTKLERRGNMWVYELKVVGSDGRMREIHVDAKTAVLLPDKRP